MRLSLLSIFLVACSSSFVPGEGDDLDAGPSSFDGAPPSRFDAGRDAARAVDGAPPPDRGVESPTEPPRRPDGTVLVRCGADTCPAGFECCHTTTECHDPAIADSCPRPGPIPGALRPCGSNAHCGPGEFCRGGCGAGDCAPRPTRADCDRSTGWIEVCACDGNTYADECVAASAGIASGGRGRCGGPLDDLGVFLCEDSSVCPEGSTCEPSPAAPGGLECVREDPAILCTHDGHCPGGTVCCEAVSLCVTPAADAYCDPTSGRSNPPCAVDADCHEWAAAQRPGLPDYGDVFCAGDGCEGGGFCRFRGEESCTGVLDPVCGCNGMTYQNECEAFQEGQRIAARRGC